MESDNKFLENVLRESVKITQEEGLTDDEAIARVNELKTDALLEEPTTEVGKRVREVALKNDGVVSPYTEKTKFDYDDLRDKTVRPAISETFAKISEFSHLIVKGKETEEERNELSKEYNLCVLELFKILNKNNVVIGNYKYFFAAMGAIIKSLEDFTMEQVNGHKAEISSRVFQTKNPGTGKFDHAYATYQDVVDILMKTRKDTGDNLDDYFNLTEE